MFVHVYTIANIILHSLKHIGTTAYVCVCVFACTQNTKQQKTSGKIIYTYNTRSYIYERVVVGK